MNNNSMLHWLLLVLCLAAASVLGYLIGRIYESRMRMESVPVLSVTQDTHPGIPTVVIAGIADGRLVGNVVGDVRLQIAGESVVFAEDNSFSIEPLLCEREQITVVVPDWANFVASSKGSKYYPVHSGQGQRIAPENRVYFRDENEALEEGYEK